MVHHLMAHCYQVAMKIFSKKTDPALSKEATQLFKSLLMYSGERPTPYPPAHALQVLQAGVAQPELRAEIYFQLMKQLRSNPSADSQRRYWELMALALMSFPPGSGCDDYVHVFLKSHADGAQRFLSLLHKAQYEGGQPLPPADELPTLLTGFFGRQVRSRYSVVES